MESYLKRTIGMGLLAMAPQLIEAMRSLEVQKAREVERIAAKSKNRDQALSRAEVRRNRRRERNKKFLQHCS